MQIRVVCTLSLLAVLAEAQAARAEPFVPEEVTKVMPGASFTVRSEGETIVRRCITGKYDLTLTSDKEGQSTFVARVSGEKVFSGPFTTEAQRAKAPAETWLVFRMEFYRHELGIASSDEWVYIASRLLKVLGLQETMQQNFSTELAHTIHADPDHPNDFAAATHRLQVEADQRPSLTPDADLKTDLGTARDRRKKVQQDLETSQADLQKVLTVRQEVILVRYGVLP